MSAYTPQKTPPKANLLIVDRFTTWNFIDTTAIANDDSRTGGQSYKATAYRVIAIKPTPRWVRSSLAIAHAQVQTVDWSAQQVLGSLHSYPDWEEERLASPEVPSAGSLRIHSTLVTAIWRWMWQVLNVFWCIAHEANKTGVTVTPKQDTPVQETLLGVMSEAPWLTVLCCLFVYGRRLGQWNPVCYM